MEPLDHSLLFRWFVAFSIDQTAPDARTLAPPESPAAPRGRGDTPGGKRSRSRGRIGPPRPRALDRATTEGAPPAASGSGGPRGRPARVAAVPPDLIREPWVVSQDHPPPAPAIS
jgi:hypothetical protein